MAPAWHEVDCRVIPDANWLVPMEHPFPNYQCGGWVRNGRTLDYFNTNNDISSYFHIVEGVTIQRLPNGQQKVFQEVFMDL